MNTVTKWNEIIQLLDINDQVRGLRGGTLSRARLLGVSLMIAVGLAQTASGEIQFSATLDRTTFVSGQEMHLTLIFINDGESGVPLLKPTYLDEDFIILEVSDADGGMVVPEQVRAQKILGRDDPVLLSPAETLERQFDLHNSYPVGLKPGRYLLSVAYQFSATRYPEKSAELKDVNLNAAPVAFRVTARNALQQDEYVRYRSVLAGSSPELHIERAREALGLYPKGLFARRLRIELAAALWQNGRLPQAIDEYRLVLTENGASAATRLLAKRNLGLVYHELGDLERAIEAITSVDTREARIYRGLWKRELGEQGSER